MKKGLNLKQIEIGFHILFWIIYFIYPVIKFGDQEWFSYNIKEAILNTAFLGTVVYITVYFLFKNPNKKYIVFLLFIYPLFIYLNCTFSLQFCQCNFRTCIINNTSEYLLVNTFFIALLTVRKNVASQRALERIEQEKMQAELKSLKAQLNPHFLFNTLNMLYSNALEKDESLADKILKLSDSLHYLLHEGEKREVPLRKEIEFINDYIELQKARLDDKIEVHFSTSIDHTSKKIPPLLMIPFIENAFKYSSMVEGDGLPLFILLELENNRLVLEVQNQFDSNYSQKQNHIWKDSGIGIQNVKRRLDLLYPDDHQLNFTSLNNIFTVNLEIYLT